jgi:homocysteine S-methyltransferase
MSDQSFKKVIKEGIPLLFDGATGTELYNRGVFINRCFEEANLSNQALIRDICEDYKQAGAMVLSTNSWGANPIKLGQYNLKDQTYLINLNAARLAREVAGTSAFVAGSVGPLGVRIEPWGPTSFEEAEMAFADQLRGLVDGGVDVISLETFGDISEIQQAFKACKKVCPDLPVIAHITVGLEGTLPVGTPHEWAIEKLIEWGADVVGFNCSLGPQPLLTIVRKVIETFSHPVIVQPNAGLPRSVDGRSIYMCTPEYMAEFTKDFLQSGVQFVGGCCGTSAQHIKAMAKAFRQQKAMRSFDTRDSGLVNFSDPTLVKLTSSEEVEKVERIPLKDKSKWSKKIAEGELVTSIELLPPAGVVADKIIARSKQLKEAGIDAINIPDGPRASARMSAILTAVMIEQEVGIETVLHYTCRDRNLLGMQSDMLGAHAIGLRNLLLVTGDPPKLGNYPDATGVFDVDAIGLTNMVSRLNSGLDLGGRSIGEPTALSIGVGVNPVHQDFEYEMKRFKYKVEAGAEWAITQPVFDIEALKRFLDYIDTNNFKIPIVAGIWPLLSYRNALFMHNEVPGVVIPQEIFDKMSKPSSTEDAKKVGVEIAHKMFETVKSDVQGVQVSAPFGRIDLALDVLGF